MDGSEVIPDPHAGHPFVSAPYERLTSPAHCLQESMVGGDAKKLILYFAGEVPNRGSVLLNSRPGNGDQTIVEEIETFEANTGGEKCIHPRVQSSSG
jgi:hypothetical protein